MIAANDDPRDPSGDDEGLTGSLRRWKEGDADAYGEAFEAAYQHLRGIAHHRLRSGSSDSINTTALVHEAYLRLAGAGNVDWQSRGHFFAVASRAMRRILVDHARERRALKRGGDLIQVEFRPEQLGASLDPGEADPEALLALDHSLTRLGQESPRQAQAVELRYFGALTLEEVGETLGISAPTAMRDLRYALAWLASELTGGGSRQ